MDRRTYRYDLHMRIYFLYCVGNAEKYEITLPEKQFFLCRRRGKNVLF
jgi:hypothetical protein